MEQITQKRQVVDCVTALTCDRCAATFETSGSDRMEVQEFLRWRNTGGYASVFGDGASMAVDLCQHCVKEVLGPWIKVAPSTG